MFNFFTVSISMIPLSIRNLIIEKDNDGLSTSAISTQLKQNYRTVVSIIRRKDQIKKREDQRRKLNQFIND